MDEYTPPPIGALVTVENTSDFSEEMRDYYAAVVGWQMHPISMGDYDDYVTVAQDGSWVGGICSRRGPNSDLPSGWIPCFRVASVHEAIATAVAQGGKQIGAIRETSPGSLYAVIEDPHGSRISVIDFAEAASE